MITSQNLQMARELVQNHYVRRDLPIFAQKEFMTRNGKSYNLAHWHEDIEIVHILEGELLYRIDKEDVLVGAGESLIINFKQTHGATLNSDFCRFEIMLIHPDILSRNLPVYNKYLFPMIQDPDFNYLLLSKDSPYSEQLKQSLNEAIRLVDKQEFGYELRLFANIYQLIYLMISLYHCTRPEEEAPEDEGSQIQRRMIDYIYHNYSGKITLEDIAAAGGICRSRCCKIFKDYLEETPIEFLNRYRLEISCELLKNTEDNISQISQACGFSQQSYYNRQFLKAYGCTPKEYRKKA